MEWQNPGRILITHEEIKHKVKEIGDSITADYQGGQVLLIGVLKGAVIFLADLLRCLDMPVEADFMALSSYGSSTKTSGVVRILKDLDRSIEQENVIIVEDIVDTGLTLQFLYRNLWQRYPNSIKVASLLDKPEKRQVEMEVDYCGFTISDHFVVGYGLDFDEKYRNLPDIHILEE